MTLSPDFAARQSDFEHAWIDLGERLNSGLTALENMSQSVTRPEDVTRLTAKAAGVNDALDIHERLSVEKADDLGGAWRIFTDEVTALLNDTSRAAGHHQGAHLALTYQRGYGRNVDAPVPVYPYN